MFLSRISLHSSEKTARITWGGEIVNENYYRVKADVAELVLREIARIEADPKLAELLPKKK